MQQVREGGRSSRFSYHEWCNCWSGELKIKRAIIGEGAVISDGVEIDGTEEVQVVGYDEVVGVATDED